MSERSKEDLLNELNELFVDGVDISEILEKAKEVNRSKKREKSNTQNIRFFFFFILSFLTYGIFVRNLFRREQLLVSGIVFCILFIELMFLSVDIRGYRKRKMWGLLILLGLILWFFIPHPVRQIVVSMWMSLITIGYLLYYLRGYFKNVRKINWFTYFTRGGYVFTLMTTITFGFAILGIHTKFPFECSQISNINGKLIKQSTSGLLFGSTDEKTIFDFKRDIEELEGVQTQASAEDGSMLNELRTTFKSNMMDGFIETKNSINSKVCETVISQINQVYQNPVFQIGVVFGVYLLFYGVIRLVVWIIAILGYVIFTIARLLGLYKVVKTYEMVEDVE